jgi:hypothetical protein
MEFLCPDLVRTLVYHDEQAESLRRSIDELAHQAPRHLADLMVRRREDVLMRTIPMSHLFESAARERMEELRAAVSDIKSHMSLLHTQAKDHRTDERRTTQFDDTVSLQDRIGELLKQMVPAQSELRLLERTLEPLVDLQRKRERELDVLEEFVGHVVPALQNVGDSLSPRDARSLVLLQFRDILSRRLEAAVAANRDTIVYDLETVWTGFEEGAILDEEATYRRA